MLIYNDGNFGLASIPKIQYAIISTQFNLLNVRRIVTCDLINHDLAVRRFLSFGWKLGLCVNEN